MRLFALMFIVFSFCLLSFPNFAQAQTDRSRAFELAAEIEEYSSELRRVQFAPTRSIRNKPAGRMPYEIQAVTLEVRILETAKELDKEIEGLKSIGRARFMLRSDDFLAVEELRSLPKKVRKERKELLREWRYNNKRHKGRRHGYARYEDGTIERMEMRDNKEILKDLRKSLEKYGSVSTGKAGTRFGNIEMPDEEVGAWDEEVEGEFTCASLF